MYKYESTESMMLSTLLSPKVLERERERVREGERERE